MSGFLETIRRHGLTPERHRLMLLDQEGLCLLCKRYLPLVVDHYHRCCPGHESCGDCVRALLCSGCNTALGMLKDNPETVSRMLDFLLSQPERTLKPRTSLKSPGPQPEIPADPPGPTVSEDIVEALNYAAGPVGISELARKTGRSKAGVHQMVHTMAGRGEVVLTPNGYELPT